MIVNVTLVDGRVFQFASRNDLNRVVEAQPGADDVQSPAWLRRPGEAFTGPVRVTQLRKASIVSTVGAEDEAASPADLPALAEAERRRARYEAREREAATASAA